MAVPKKNDGRPSARGAVETSNNERILKIRPNIINRAEITQANVNIILSFHMITGEIQN